MPEEKKEEPKKEPKEPIAGIEDTRKAIEPPPPMPEVKEAEAVPSLEEEPPTLPEPEELEPKKLIDGMEEATGMKVGVEEFPIVIRCQSDKAYILEKRWVRNLETLEQLGFSLTDVVDIPPDVFAKYREGESIDLKGEMESSPPTSEQTGGKDEKSYLY